MKKTYVAFKLFLLNGLILVGCNKKNNNNKKGYSEAEYNIISNINKAKSLFIGNKTSNLKRSSSQGETDTSSLFMLTKEGYVEEVSYSFLDCNDEGNCEKKVEAHLNTPKWVSEINQRYLFICFTSDPSYWQYSSSQENFNYLVDKESGRFYRMPTTFVPLNTYCDNYDYRHVMPNREVFMSDENGYIYFQAFTSDSTSFSYPIKKLDTSDINNITVTTVSLKDDSIDSNYIPAVSKKGSLAYCGQNGSSSISRYIKPDGSFSNLGFQNQPSDFWTGYDGNIYCVKSTNVDDYYLNKVNKVVETETGIQFEPYGTSNIQVSGAAQYYCGYESRGRIYLDSLKRILKVDYDGIYELYNEETNDVAFFPYNSLGFARPKISVSSNDYLFFYTVDNNNNSVLLKLDPKNGYSKTVLMNNKYDLSSFVIDKDNVITFTGLRFTDGAYVVGTLDGSGNESILDISLDHPVESLINL